MVVSDNKGLPIQELDVLMVKSLSFHNKDLRGPSKSSRDPFIHELNVKQSQSACVYVDF